ELGRLLRPGGRLIISALHPFLTNIGWQAGFASGSDSRGFVREHPHTHAKYLSAFAAAGMRLRSCHEPVFDEDAVRAARRVSDRTPEAAIPAYVGVPAVLLWELEKR